MLIHAFLFIGSDAQARNFGVDGYEHFRASGVQRHTPQKSDSNSQSLAHKMSACLHSRGGSKGSRLGMGTVDPSYSHEETVPAPGRLGHSRGGCALGSGLALASTACWERPPSEYVLRYTFPEHLLLSARRPCRRLRECARDFTVNHSAVLLEVPLYPHFPDGSAEVEATAPLGGGVRVEGQSGRAAGASHSAHSRPDSGVRLRSKDHRPQGDSDDRGANRGPLHSATPLTNTYEGCVHQGPQRQPLDTGERGRWGPHSYRVTLQSGQESREEGEARGRQAGAEEGSTSGGNTTSRIDTVGGGGLPSGSSALGRPGSWQPPWSTCLP